MSIESQFFFLSPISCSNHENIKKIFNGNVHISTLLTDKSAVLADFQRRERDLGRVGNDELKDVSPIQLATLVFDGFSLTSSAYKL